jgi:hypothetical protein
MATAHAMNTEADVGQQAVENIRLTARALIAIREMTSSELGQVIGVNRTPMYDRLHGRKPFTTAEVALMAEFFGVSVQAFFDGPDALFNRHAAYSGSVRRGSEITCSRTEPRPANRHRPLTPAPITAIPACGYSLFEIDHVASPLGRAA